MLFWETLYYGHIYLCILTMKRKVRIVQRGNTCASDKDYGISEIADDCRPIADDFYPRHWFATTNEKIPDHCIIMMQQPGYGNAIPSMSRKVGLQRCTNKS